MDLEELQRFPFDAGKRKLNPQVYRQLFQRQNIDLSPEIELKPRLAPFLCRNRPWNCSSCQRIFQKNLIKGLYGDQVNQPDPSPDNYLDISR